MLEAKYEDGELIRIAKKCEGNAGYVNVYGDEALCGEQAVFLYKWKDGSQAYLCEECAEKWTDGVELEKGEVNGSV